MTQNARAVPVFTEDDIDNCVTAIKREDSLSGRSISLEQDGMAYLLTIQGRGLPRPVTVGCIDVNVVARALLEAPFVEELFNEGS